MARTTWVTSCHLPHSSHGSRHWSKRMVSTAAKTALLQALAAGEDRACDSPGGKVYVRTASIQGASWTQRENEGLSLKAERGRREKHLL